MLAETVATESLQLEGLLPHRCRRISHQNHRSLDGAYRPKELNKIVGSFSLSLYLSFFLSIYLSIGIFHGIWMVFSQIFDNIFPWKK